MCSRFANQVCALWMAVALIAAAAGVGLGFAAWSSASEWKAVWAAVLLLGAPAFAVMGTPGVREDASGDLDPTPDLTVDRLRRAERALSIIRLARAVVLMAISYLLVLWFCETGGLMSIRRFLLAYTVICLVAWAAYFPWLARRERWVGAICETQRAQLKTFKASRDWSPD
jgi:hypothetical protein